MIPPRTPPHPPRAPRSAAIIPPLAAAFDELWAMAEHAICRDGRMSAPVVKRRLEKALREMGGSDVR